MSLHRMRRSHAHGGLRPYRLEQLRLGNQLPGPAGELPQHGRDLGRQEDDAGGSPQQAVETIEVVQASLFASLDGVCAQRSGRGPHVAPRPSLSAAVVCARGSMNPKHHSVGDRHALYTIVIRMERRVSRSTTIVTTFTDKDRREAARQGVDGRHRGLNRRATATEWHRHRRDLVEDA